MAGFTLIELLVVIAIVAVLMSIMLPALGQARDTARRTQCQSNLRQLHIGTQAYINDYGRYPGYYKVDNNGNFRNFWYWYRHVSEYIHPGPEITANNTLNINELATVFYCPAEPVQSDGHDYLAYAIYGPIGANFPANVVKPSETMLYVDRENVTVGSSAVGTRSSDIEDLDHRHPGPTVATVYADGSGHIYSYPQTSVNPDRIPPSHWHFHWAYWNLRDEAKP